jgi:hypothetical protein
MGYGVQPPAIFADRQAQILPTDRQCAGAQRQQKENISRLQEYRKSTRQLELNRRRRPTITSFAGFGHGRC